MPAGGGARGRGALLRLRPPPRRLLRAAARSTPGRTWRRLGRDRRRGSPGGETRRRRRRLPAEVRRPALEDGRRLRGLRERAMQRHRSGSCDNRLLVLARHGARWSPAGVVAWTRLPIDAFPDVTNTQVMILAKAPGPRRGRRRAARQLPHRAGDARPAARARRCARSPRPGSRRWSSSSRTAPTPTGRGRSSSSGSRGAREQLPPGRRAGARPDQHRARRDLPVHARGRRPARRWSCARSRTGSSRRCSSPSPA